LESKELKLESKIECRGAPPRDFVFVRLQTQLSENIELSVTHHLFVDFIPIVDGSYSAIKFGQKMSRAVRPFQLTYVSFLFPHELRRD